MKLNKSLHLFYPVATLIILSTCHMSLATNERTETEISLDQAIQQQLEKEDGHATNLKRKRRYLEFPEGSSFQLVYDLIVGVVDYTNYLILGVTVALAWELPSKPPSEILDDLTERLKDGTLGTSRNDTVANIKYVDFKKNATHPIDSNNKYYKILQPIFKPPMNSKYYINRQPDSYYKIQDYRNSQNSLKGYKGNTKNYGRRKNDYYYTPKAKHPFTKWTQNRNLQSQTTKETQYPWWNLPTRLKNSFAKRPSTRRFDQNTVVVNRHRRPIENYKNFQGTGRAEHRIFPIFGKRSIPDSNVQNETEVRYRRSGIRTETPSEEDRIHIEHHRTTRHELYDKIETYLNGRGSNGHHCVLRALCETGKRTHEQKPGSFVAEIMRAVFTLPESLDTSADSSRQFGYKGQRYDTANTLIGDCASRYHLCKESLWSSHFIA